MSNQRGFTIAEVVVAIIMVSIGIIGVAKATAEIVSMVARGDRSVTASTYAQDRMEQMRAAGCGSMAEGTETYDGSFSLTWTVTARNNVREVQLVAEYPGGRGMRVDTFETSVPCI